MKKYVFEPKSVCAKEIEFSLDNDTIYGLKIKGGCPGYKEAISILAEGMHKDEFINKLGGIECGNKNTSCVDQIASFLKICFMKAGK